VHDFCSTQQPKELGQPNRPGSGLLIYGGAGVSHCQWAPAQRPCFVVPNLASGPNDAILKPYTTCLTFHCTMLLMDEQSQHGSFVLAVILQTLSMSAKPVCIMGS
jgi:hypothetical protein